MKRCYCGRAMLIVKAQRPIVRPLAPTIVPPASAYVCLMCDRADLIPNAKPSGDR